MIVLFLICLAALVICLERSWADLCLHRLRYHFSHDITLAEPDQVVTLTSQVENRGLLPILFVRLTEYLPRSAAIHEDEAWMQAHCRVSPIGKQYAEESFYLLPHRRRTGVLHISLPRRGGYRLGEATLTTGDFLGLKDTSQRLGGTADVVVIPRRCEDADVLRVLGGLMGDISVRRFILEDPILTVGFRAYTGREPMKAIAWSQSARSGQLLVKQYDYTVDATVTVLLNAEGGSEEAMEQCFSLTRTTCEELEARGIPYALRTNGDLIGPLGPVRRVNEGLGHQHLSTILYALGRASCSCYSTLERLVDTSMRAARPNQSYILITPPLSPAQDRLLDRLRTVSGGQVYILTGKEADPCTS